MIRKPIQLKKKEKKVKAEEVQELILSSSDEPIRMPNKVKKMNLVHPSVAQKTRETVKKMTLKLFPSLADKDIDLD